MPRVLQAASGILEAEIAIDSLGSLLRDPEAESAIGSR
jgi:hypothetical protein